MHFYVILAFLLNHVFAAPYYSGDNSNVAVSHKISVIAPFPNLKIPITTPSVEETNSFSHETISKNTNELNKSLLGIESLLEGLKLPSLLGGLLSPLLSKEQGSSGGDCGENCGNTGLQSSKSDNTPCGNEAMKENSKNDDENQDPSLLNVDLDLLTGIQSLPIDTLDQLSGILSGDTESESTPTNSASAESSPQCFSCDSSPSSSSDKNNQASTGAGDDLGGLINIDADILRSKSILKHKFLTVKRKSNRNIKREKREINKIDDDHRSNKDEMPEKELLKENEYDRAENVEKQKITTISNDEEINTEDERLEVLSVKNQVSEKETMMNTDTSMIKDNTKQLFDETTDSRISSTIQDSDDSKLGFSSKNTGSSAEDHYLEASKSSYKESEYFEISVYEDNENIDDMISSSYYKNNEFSKNKKEYFNDISETQLNSGTVDNIDNKMIENKFSESAERGVTENGEKVGIIPMSNDYENHSQIKNMKLTDIIFTSNELQSAQSSDKNNVVKEENEAMEMVEVEEDEETDKGSPMEIEESSFNNEGFSGKESMANSDISNIELDKNQITDGNPELETTQDNNGKSELMKDIGNAEDNQYNDKTLEAESTKSTKTEQYDKFLENSNQDSNDFTDSQSKSLEVGVTDIKEESETSRLNVNDIESSMSEGFQENEHIESIKSTNEEEGFNSLTQNILKDSSFSQIFKGFWPNLFRNDLFSLLQRRTLPEVPFKRSLPVTSRRRAEIPDYRSFPQSVAGSDLYGAYAYANVGPVRNIGFEPNEIGYEQGTNGEGEEIPFGEEGENEELESR